MARIPVELRTLRGLALAACFVASAAHAETYLVNSSFAGGPFDAIGVTPFDPARGTLDAVHVEILGTLSVVVATTPLIGGTGPVPYPYTVEVSQDFFGLGGRFFDFSLPARFDFSSVASGAGEPAQLTTGFVIDFTFNHATDLAGAGTFVSSASATSATLLPPPVIAGSLDKFLPSITGVHEVDMLLSSRPLVGPVSVQNAFAQGALTFQYDYTPTAVPEPETYAMLMAGLGLLVFIARRRRALNSPA